MSKSGTFDPFSEDNDAGTSYGEYSDDINESFNTSGFDTTFDTTFDDSAFDFDAIASPKSKSLDLSGGMMKGTTTASGGFHFPDTPASTIRSGSARGDDDFLDISSDNKHEIPIKVALHEEMSCVYDGVSRTSSLSIEGIVSVKSSVALEGKEFRLTLKDPEQHIDKLSFDASFVSEANAAPEEGDFNRVFSAILPDYGLPSDTDIQMVKYTCTSSLVPVPILVQSKVRVAGKLCRVAVKIRSNPSNQRNLGNVAILLAVPPDLNGESVKMNKKGAIWDGMKRIITWSFNELKPGQTLELQAQLEFKSLRDAQNKTKAEPKFPVLVRFDAKDDQLSSVDLEIGDPSTDEFMFDEFKLNLSKRFRVLHRKV